MASSRTLGHHTRRQLGAWLRADMRRATGLASLPAELHTSAEIEHRTHAENVSVFVIRIPRERIGSAELPIRSRKWRIVIGRIDDLEIGQMLAGIRTSGDQVHLLRIGRDVGQGDPLRARRSP